MKTNENFFVDYYKNNDYYDDTINNVNNDENIDESTKKNFMIYFLKIFIFLRLCNHCNAKFSFNNQLYRHFRQRICQLNSFVDSFANVVRQNVNSSTKQFFVFIEIIEFVNVFHQSIMKIIFNQNFENHFIEIINFFVSINTNFDYAFRK